MFLFPPPPPQSTPPGLLVSVNLLIKAAQCTEVTRLYTGSFKQALGTNLQLRLFLLISDGVC